MTVDAADPELRRLAERLVWWKAPEVALADTRHFLAHAMTWASWEEMAYVRSVYGDDALRTVLADPPPGVFDRRSWAYWHARFGIELPPALPRRRL